MLSIVQFTLIHVFDKFLPMVSNSWFSLILSVNVNAFLATFYLLAD